MVEGYKGRIFYEQLDASSQEGRSSSGEPQLSVQSNAHSEAGKQAEKRTPLEELEDGVKERLEGIRESRRGPTAVPGKVEPGL